MYRIFAHSSMLLCWKPLTLPFWCTVMQRNFEPHYHTETFACYGIMQRSIEPLWHTIMQRIVEPLCHTIIQIIDEPICHTITEVLSHPGTLTWGEVLSHSDTQIIDKPLWHSIVQELLSHFGMQNHWATLARYHKVLSHSGTLLWTKLNTLSHSDTQSIEPFWHSNTLSHSGQNGSVY